MQKMIGYAKGHGFKIDRTNHACNVVKLEGYWYLIDSTCGEGHLGVDGRCCKQLNPFYFLVRPEQMIYRHFPEDSQW